MGGGCWLLFQDQQAVTLNNSANNGYPGSNPDNSTYRMMPVETGSYRAPEDDSANAWNSNAFDNRPAHIIEEEDRKARAPSLRTTRPEQQQAEERSKAFIASQPAPAWQGKKSDEEIQKESSMSMQCGMMGAIGGANGMSMAPPPYNASAGISPPPGMHSLGMPAGQMVPGGPMGAMEHNMDSPLCKYRCIMEAVLADGKVTEAERNVAEKKRRVLGITDEQHELLLAEFGWTVDMFILGETPDEHICVVCQTEKASHATIPCGHRCLCDECQRHMISKPCPMCRQTVEKIIRIFDN